MIRFLVRREDLADLILKSGPGRALPRSVRKIGVLIGIDVDQRISPEVDRIRTERPCPVVLIGIEDLDGQGFPSPGGSAVERPRPALSDAAELPLDMGDELVGDGVAVRAQIGRIHGVGIVEIRVRMMDGHQDHAGKPGLSGLEEPGCNLAQVFRPGARAFSVP
jgi:hypothetical protein